MPALLRNRHNPVVTLSQTEARSPTRRAVTTPTPTHGADASGLICGYLITPASGTQPIASDAAAAQLDALGSGAAPPEADAPFLSLHFNLAHTGTLPWLHRHAALSDEFFEELKDGLHSTRIERNEQSLIAVINDVHVEFSFEPSDISTLWTC